MNKRRFIVETNLTEKNFNQFLVKLGSRLYVLSEYKLTREVGENTREELNPIVDDNPITFHNNR